MASKPRMSTEYKYTNIRIVVDYHDNFTMRQENGEIFFDDFSIMMRRMLLSFSLH